MINTYINKLIENLPEEIKKNRINKTPIKIDLILDGGLFNGSYLVGALYFIKEMETRKYIKVERISGCSIGSLVGLLYFVDALDELPRLYESLLHDFTIQNNFALLKKLKQILSHRIPNNICEKLFKRLYISFNNIKTGKKIVNKTYKNVDEVIDCIIRSCFVPFLIDGNIVYKCKYIDGLNPHIFKTQNKKYNNRKVLFMNLSTLDKIFGMINIKNEKTNLHRILSGMLDVYVFFIKGTKTYMCSFVNDWNILDTIYIYVRYSLEGMFVHNIHWLIYIYKIILQKIKKYPSFDLLFIYYKKNLASLLDKYCL